MKKFLLVNLQQSYKQQNSSEKGGGSKDNPQTEYEGVSIISGTGVAISTVVV
jgi:hypothetical protein